jgi:hypothetical protein
MARLSSDFKGIKGGVMGGRGGNGQRYPEARQGWREARWRGAAGSVKKKKMTGGAQVSAVEREKALRMECVKSRRKRIS